MNPDLLQGVHIVLVGTTHPGNIGATARAMKNMGLSRLWLVQPRHFPHAEASVRASGADDILSAATVCPSLDEAIRDCALVLGTSARTRSIAWPELGIREGARRCVDQAPRGGAALVFGREKAGLSNDELDRCHFLTRIPCNPDFSSLNLAASVQVLSYELRMAAEADVGPAPAFEDPDDRPASAGELGHFYTHLQNLLIRLEFLDPRNPRHLMRRLRRLYNRVHPSRRELNILRGILTACGRHLDTTGGPPRPAP